MLYTGKGDGGQTGTFGTKEKMSKSSVTAEALGALDEANSYFGLLRASVGDEKFSDTRIADIILREQNNLFIVQAQIAGADKKLADGEVRYIEETVNAIEKELPVIKSFFIPGANTLSAHADVTRTLVRRAERRLVALSENAPGKIDPFTLSFVNRLSSLCYAFARLFARADGDEHAPTY